MVTVETNGTITRVNQSKVRRDHDPWHDVPLPPILEDNQVPAAPSEEQGEQQEAGAPASYSVPINFNNSDFFANGF
jgi:hypothetical protein